MSQEDAPLVVELDSRYEMMAAWEREKLAFWRMRESLMPDYAGRYVAVLGERVVDSDEDQATLIVRVCEHHGQVPMYVQLVTPGPLPVKHIRGPRVARP